MNFKQLFRCGLSVVLTLAISTSLMLQAIAVEEIQNGLRFDSVKSEYAQVNGTLDVPNTTEVWVKLDAGENRRQVILGNYGDGVTNTWGLEVNTDNTLRYWEKIGSNQISCKFDTGSQKIDICTNEWMLISVVRNVSAKQLSVYIDGEFKATMAAGKDFQSGALTKLIQFGKDYHTTPYYLDGTIGEVRLWSDERTAEEIKEYAEKSVVGTEDGLAHAWQFSESKNLGPNTVFQDLVAGGVDVTATGFTEQETEPDPTPVDRGGLRLDAVEKEYAQVQGTISIPTTVETWIKLDVGTNTRQIIMNNYAGGGNSWGIEVSAQNTLRYWEEVSGSSANAFFNDINICTGEWMLISVVRDTANKQILAYINGELKGTQPATSLVDTTQQLTKWLCFGSDYHSTPIYMKGELNEVRMWNGIRTADEIKTYYTAETIGNEDGLAHDWKFAHTGEVYRDTVFPDSVSGGINVKAVGFPVDPDTTYTVTFNLSGGTVEEQIAQQTIRVGGKAAAPTQTPTKEGFSYLGWYKDSSCTEKWDFENDTVEADTTIYAGYQFLFASAELNGLTGISFTSSADQMCSADRLSGIPRTFEATIKLPEDLTGRGGVICGNYMDAGYYDYDLGYVNLEIGENGQPRLYWQQERRNQSSPQSVVISGVDLRQNEWVHLALTFDEEADIVKCYVNGTLVSTVSDGAFNPVIPAQALKIGGDYSGTGGQRTTSGYNNQYFKGEIANVSIWSTVRTADAIADDITALKTDGSVPSTGDGLLASWSFKELSGGVYQDMSVNNNDVAEFVDWITPGFAEGDYTMVALPDTQFLSQNYPEKYKVMTQWIADNEDTYHIQAVMHMGDMVNSGTNAQWDACKKAMDILDTTDIAWMPMRGNHDPSASFNSTFGYNDFAGRSYFGGSYDEDKLDQTYWNVTVGEREYLILSLGWAPTQGALDWAKGFIEANPKKNVIITAHAFMYWDGTHLNDEDLDYTSAYASDGMDGSEIWEQLGGQYPNVVLAMGGHIGFPDVIQRTDTNGAGEMVTSLLCDAQGIDYTYGLGMMMMLTFHENSDSVDVNWYSTSEGKLFRSRNQFEIEVPHVGEEETPATHTVAVNFGSGDGTYTKGETVSITAEPKIGYTFKKWELISGSVALADAYAATTTFTMPDTDLALEAVYTENSSGSGYLNYTCTLTFDANGGSAIPKIIKTYGASVDLSSYIPVYNGYKFKGWHSNKELTKPTTSVMLTADTTLYAKWEKLAVNPFVDVKVDDYYYDAVLWAVEKGITKETTGNTFASNSTCTRAQTLTFLWRAMGCPEPTATICPFTDVAKDAYYYEAVLWAVERGITVPTSNNTFSPDATVTRSQCITFLWRTAGMPAVNTANPFRDMENGAYYVNAVLWAVEKGITEGTSTTTFSPATPCTRAQVITFLYRHLGK